jgi:hypothetical protein
MGILGAADIWLYHTKAHALRTHPGARAELITHFLRGPTYCALFLLVPNFTFHGAFFVGLIGLYAVDLVISVADFALEPESRRTLGGLPRGEYLLHVFLAMLFGGLVVATFMESEGAMHHEAALTWRPIGDHAWVRGLLALMAPAVLITGLLDLRAVIRLGRASE